MSKQLPGNSHIQKSQFRLALAASLLAFTSAFLFPHAAWSQLIQEEDFRSDTTQTEVSNEAEVPPASQPRRSFRINRSEAGVLSPVQSWQSGGQLRGAVSIYQNRGGVLSPLRGSQTEGQLSGAVNTYQNNGGVFSHNEQRLQDSRLRGAVYRNRSQISRNYRRRSKANLPGGWHAALMFGTTGIPQPHAFNGYKGPFGVKGGYQAYDLNGDGVLSEEEMVPIERQIRRATQGR